MVTSEKNEKQSDSKNEVKNHRNSAMPIPTASTSPASTSGPTSTTASNSSGVGQTSNGGSYVRSQRPRQAGQTNVSNSSSSKNSSTTGVTTLPASAVTAAPYVPSSYQAQNAEFMHHPHQHHIAYAGYEAPPPPMGQPPPPGWVPYFYEQGSGPHPSGGTPGPPPFVQHMCTIPPPQVVVSSATGKGAGARSATPSACVVSSSSDHAQTVQPNVAVAGGHTSQSGQEYEVEYHLHQGEMITLELGDGRVQIIPGKLEFVLHDSIVH